MAGTSRPMSSSPTSSDSNIGDDSFLASFINHEQRGIPKAAGTAQSSDFDLQRMRRLLAALGNPQNDWRAVHIAGSKGKGSTATMVANILAAAGLRVGLYTSPHLRTIHERIATSSAATTATTHVTATSSTAATATTDTSASITSTAAINTTSAATTADAGANDSTPAATPTQIAASPLQQPLSGMTAAVPSGRLSSVPPAAWSSLVELHRSAIEGVRAAEGGALSHFEVVTALAFRHFSDVAVDVAVVETGLGGITDATNVIEPSNLLAAVITPIGMEHVAALGGTIKSIAAAKAGIMKAGRPVVLAEQPRQEALDVLLQNARDAGCSVVWAEDQVTVQHQQYKRRGRDAAAATAVGGNALHEVLDVRLNDTVEGTESFYHEAVAPYSAAVEMQLVGSHQHVNVATAVATAWQLRGTFHHITWQHVVQGLARTFLEGRFQVVELLAPDGGARYAVLDGAHTAESAAALTATLRHAFPAEPVALVLAMAEDKEHAVVVTQLRGMAPKVALFTSVAIAGSAQRSVAPGTLAGHWQVAALKAPSQQQRPFRCRELIQANIRSAIERARQELVAFGSDGVIVVTGSLHAVAQAQDVLASA